MATSSNALFPLPLTTFERYMLADDRPGYPMTFVVQARLSGEMQRPALEAALEEVFARHPLLSALVDRSARPGPCWFLEGQNGPRVDWGERHTPVGCPDGERIDLTSEPGLRAWIRRGGGSTELTFQAHHSCVDGLGMLQFFGELLGSYARRVEPTGRYPALPPLEPERLRTRGLYTVELPTPASRRRAMWGIAREAAKWLGRSPAPLYPPNSRSRENDASPAFPGFHFHTFGEEQTRQLRTWARRHQATLNDLLLCEVFRTLHGWNRQFHPRGRDRWLRINMPMSLRERRHDRMPIANVMSHAFLTRRSRECQEAETLLEGIRDETAVVRRWRLGLLFLGGMSYLQWIRGAMPLAMALMGHRCYATTALTFMGDPGRRLTVRLPREEGKIRAGDVVVERLIGVPPMRPKTRAVFGAAVYAGRLVVAARGDRHCFSSEATAQLLDACVARLSQTAAQAHGEGKR